MREAARMIIVLSVIAGLSGLTLASLRQATGPLIEEQVLTYVQGPSLGQIFADTENNAVRDRKTFRPPGADRELTVFPARRQGRLVGVSFETSAKGYGGEIGVMVGFTMPEGKLAGIAITTMKETPGVGSRVAKHGFTTQFRGHGLDNLDLRSKGGDIDAVSGATISSTAATAAVKQAAQDFKAIREELAKAWPES